MQAASVLWVRYGYPHLWVLTFLDVLPRKATLSSHIKYLILKSNVILILMTQITYTKGYLLCYYTSACADLMRVSLGVCCLLCSYQV